MLAFAAAKWQLAYNFYKHRLMNAKTCVSSNDLKRAKQGIIPTCSKFFVLILVILNA